MKNNIIILGDGLLGSELHKQSSLPYISRKKDGFDINNIESFREYFLESFDGQSITRKYNMIINCIANTNTYSEDKQLHWDVNYVFVKNLIDFCNLWNIKLVHISTDYLYSGSKPESSEEDVPVHCNNWYGYTKLLADGLVQLESKDYLICRCTHKSTPFPYNKAWFDQVGNFDYVDTISSIILKLIENNATGVYNVGTEIKSMYKMALLTNKDVEPILSPSHIPKNTTMNIDKLKNILR